MPSSPPSPGRTAQRPRPPRPGCVTLPCAVTRRIRPVLRSLSSASPEARNTIPHGTSRLSATVPASRGRGGPVGVGVALGVGLGLALLGDGRRAGRRAARRRRRRRARLGIVGTAGQCADRRAGGHVEEVASRDHAHDCAVARDGLTSGWPDGTRVTRILVVEHEADAGIGLVGEQISAAGAEMVVVGPETGREVPRTAEGYDGVVVLGGSPSPTDETPAWFPNVRALHRRLPGPGGPAARDLPGCAAARPGRGRPHRPRTRGCRDRRRRAPAHRRRRRRPTARRPAGDHAVAAVAQLRGARPAAGIGGPGQQRALRQPGLPGRLDSLGVPVPSRGARRHARGLEHRPRRRARRTSA